MNVEILERKWVTVGGVDYLVTVYPDDWITNPAKEYDCFSVADIQAFYRGDWFFVEVVIEGARGAGDALCGVIVGTGDGWVTTMDGEITRVVTELIGAPE